MGGGLTSPTDQGGSQLSPAMQGILGALASYNQVNPPMPASRLPLARPTLMNYLAGAAGGYGSGYDRGLAAQNQAAALPILRSQAAGANLGNLQNLQMYNMWAPLLGQQPLQMKDLQSGNFDKPTMALASSMQGAAQGGGAQSAATPPSSISPSAVPDASQMPLRQNMLPPQNAEAQQQQPSQQQGPGMQPQAMAAAQQLPYLIRKKFGFPVSPIEDQAFAAGQNPDSPQIKQMIQLKMATDAGAIIPPGRNFPGATWGPQGYASSPQGIADMAKLTGAQSMAGVPAKEAEASFGAGLSTGVPGGGAAPASASTPSMAPMAPRGAPTMVPQGAPAAVAPLKTPKGTIIPAPQGNQVMGPGTDLITKQNTASIDTQQKWDSIRPTLEQSQNRLEALGKAFQQVQAGGLTTEKMQISNALRGARMTGLADSILSAKDTAAAQVALWNGMQDVLSSLKTINTGAGGRILNSEFQAFMEHGFSPDMAPSALHQAITQQLGLMYQTKNMIDDYYGTGRQQGWRDSNQFQSAYLKSNPIDNFVGYAKATVPPFKGMSGGPQAPVTKTINGKTYQWVP